MYDLDSLQNRKDFSYDKIVKLFKKYGLRKKYGKNEIIFYRGEKALGVYYVDDGKVRGYFSPDAGEEFTVTILDRGILIGEDAFMTPPTRILDVEALQPSIIYYLDTHTLLSLAAKEEQILQQLIGFFMKKILTLSYQMIASLQMSGRKKLAFLLLEILVQEGGEIAYTHEELAGMTGLSRVTTTSLLKILEQEGAISLKYKKIIIENEARLIEILHN